MSDSPPLDRHQVGIVAALAVVVVALIGAGAGWIADNVRSWGRWAAWATVAVFIVACVLAARRLDTPADERWYVRFPHAGRNDAGLAELPEELRKDWHFFYTKETPAEIARERRKVTRLSPFPSEYQPWHYADARDVARLFREPFQRELSTLAVWSYIHE